MPKPEKLRANIEEWLATSGNGPLVAFARCHQVSIAYTPNSSFVTSHSNSADPRWAAAQLGRDLSDNALVLGYARAFVLTPTRFFVVRLSGFKERVKEVEIDEPADGVVVHHADAVNDDGHNSRYLVVDLPDGRWALDTTVMIRKGGKAGRFATQADEFVAALGERARPIPITD